MFCIEANLIRPLRLSKTGEDFRLYFGLVSLMKVKNLRKVIMILFIKINLERDFKGTHYINDAEYGHVNAYTYWEMPIWKQVILVVLHQVTH